MAIIKYLLSTYVVVAYRRKKSIENWEILITIY